MKFWKNVARICMMILTKLCEKIIWSKFKSINLANVVTIIGHCCFRYDLELHNAHNAQSTIFERRLTFAKVNLMLTFAKVNLIWHRYILHQDCSLFLLIILNPSFRFTISNDCGCVECAGTQSKFSTSHLPCQTVQYRGPQSHTMLPLEEGTQTVQIARWAQRERNWTVYSTMLRAVDKNKRMIVSI